MNKSCQHLDAPHRRALDEKASLLAEVDRLRAIIESDRARVAEAERLDDAVDIAAGIMRLRVRWPEMTAHNVVAGLDAAKWLHRPEYVAALEMVAAAANEHGRNGSVPYGSALDDALAALDDVRAVKAVAARTYDQLTEQEGGPPNERIGERTAGETGSGEARSYPHPPGPCGTPGCRDYLCTAPGN